MGLPLLETDYGAERLQFRLRRRAVKSLTITVWPNGAVEVVAPQEAEEETIRRRVSRRGAWIQRQRRAFRQMAAPTDTLPTRTGQSVRYLGRQYRLRVTVGEADSVKLTRGVLQVAVCGEVKEEAVAHLITRWFAVRARQKLGERFARCSETVASFGICPEGFTLRRMPRRWGSCSSAGRIMLNPSLVKAPVDCIDYVIIHELCHLKHHRHDKRFYQLLSRVLPDWKRRKDRLERFAV